MLIRNTHAGMLEIFVKELISATSLVQTATGSTALGLQSCPNRTLISVLRQLLLRLAIHRRLLLRLSELLPCLLLALVVRGALDLSPLLEPGNDVLIFPAELMTQSANRAVLASGLQPQNPQRLRDNHALLVVIRRRNAFEGLKALQRRSASGSLVWDHASDSSPEHLGGCAEVEGATTGGVVASLLAQECRVLQFRAEELARDVESLASNDDDLLAIEQLLGHYAGETTQKMSLAIDHDDWLKGRHLGRP